MRIKDLTPKTAIGKAILKLRELEDYPVTPQHAKACRLGIEALNRLRNMRDLYADKTTYPRPTIRHAIAPLPSETEEEQQ